MQKHFVNFKNFVNIKKNRNLEIKLKKKLDTCVQEKLIKSFSQKYKYSYENINFKKYNNFKNINLIGMGGSALGAKAIYNFFSPKIKKKFTFVDNINLKKNYNQNLKPLNLVISKSGNTLETISNFKSLKNKKSNLFICENSNNQIRNLAKKLKSDIIDHRNYIGGRYSVLSEVGMLPALLMGLNPKKFKRFDNLIKNKRFINSLISNVSSTLYFIKKKKFNSVIINYDARSENLFNWYQQLIAESLGKKKKGLLPIISNMPKDNHSTMQLYLDGFKNNFFTFFYVNEKNSKQIKNSSILEPQYYLKNKNLSQITHAQKKATENLFKKKNIPFRSFEIKKRDEKTLGELFCFFILETILIGKSINLNPYDQPAVELIKVETKKLLIKNT